MATISLAGRTLTRSAAAVCVAASAFRMASSFPTSTMRASGVSSRNRSDAATVTGGP